MPRFASPNTAMGAASLARPVVLGAEALVDVCLVPVVAMYEHVRVNATVNETAHTK